MRKADYLCIKSVVDEQVLSSRSGAIQLDSLHERQLHPCVDFANGYEPAGHSRVPIKTNISLIPRAPSASDLSMGLRLF
jgi:hypothetical protein